MQKERYIGSLKPDFFNHMEQLSGREDTAFCYESAHANITKQEPRAEGQATA